jgi:leucyl-tRNA synthetase
MAQFGAQTAFRRTLPFSESQVLTEMLPYLKKTLNLVDAEIYTVEEARSKGEDVTQSIVESSEPGTPAFEYRNT